MATERSQHQAWYDSQVATLVELGIDMADAEAQVQWVLDRLPDGADPATYIFPPDVLLDDPSSDANIHDARRDWYSSEHIPAKYKRLLDAKTEDGQ